MNPNAPTPGCGDERRILLSRYVDGELSDAERGDVEAHTSSCAACRDLLSIFQRNETLLAGSLATEKFGGEVIESVMAEIHREAPSAEASPVDEGVLEWLRSRPLLSAAASALLAAGLVAALGAAPRGRMDELRGRLDDTRTALEELSQAHQEQARLAAARGDAYERLIASLRAEDALRHAPERWMLAYVEPTQPHHRVVRARFDAPEYRSFDVYRRGEHEPAEAFRRLNGDRRLTRPEYTDSGAAADRGYVYKFRAYRGSGETDFVESHPVVLRLPTSPRLAPEKALRVRCEEVARNLREAIFTLEREVAGRTVSQRFHVSPGQRVGEVRDVPGAGRVDFRTELVLERLQEGNQTLAVSYTEPALAADGRPILKRIENGTFVPETVQRDEVLSVRTNLRCTLKALTGEGGVELWKGGWLQVRASE